MKRVKSACLMQTIHFQLREEPGGFSHNAAVRGVQEEVAQYKAHLEKSRIRYQILREETQPDGSVIVEIKRQYNQYDCSGYLE
jgi:polyribonucleotide nucleotidyltransferase